MLETAIAAAGIVGSAKGWPKNGKVAGEYSTQSALPLPRKMTRSSAKGVSNF